MKYSTKLLSYVKHYDIINISSERGVVNDILANEIKVGDYMKNVRIVDVESDIESNTVWVEFVSGLILKYGFYKRVDIQRI